MIDLLLRHAALCGVLIAANAALAGEAPAISKAAKTPSGLSGVASVYSYSHRKTASGERLQPQGMTAAHRSLPFGTLVRVTNRRNGRAVVVRINDRGPFLRGRVIDLTPGAARSLGVSGLAPVHLVVITGSAQTRASP